MLPSIEPMKGIQRLRVLQALQIIEILCKSKSDVVKRQEVVSFTGKLCKFY